MIRFPPVQAANRSGLLCFSEHIDAHWLWSAYEQGIFPWTDPPIGWFAPPTRAILLPAEAHFPRNLGRLWRKARFEVTLDTCFEEVMLGCRRAHRNDGEWITPRFVHAYTELHHHGRAHSVELWQNDALVGGVYGVACGAMFSAESMFGLVDNASRSALYALVRLCAQLHIECIDVQVIGPVSERLGATIVSRNEFMVRLQAAMKASALPVGRWPERPFGRLDGQAP